MVKFISPQQIVHVHLSSDRPSIHQQIQQIRIPAWRKYRLESIMEYLIIFGKLVNSHIRCILTIDRFPNRRANLLHRLYQ